MIYAQKTESKHVKVKDYMHFSDLYRKFCDAHLEVTGDYPKVMYHDPHCLELIYNDFVNKYKDSKNDDCLCWETIQRMWVQSDSNQEKEHTEQIEQALLYHNCQSVQQLIDLGYVLRSENKRFYLINSDVFNFKNSAEV